MKIHRLRIRESGRSKTVWVTPCVCVCARVYAHQNRVDQKIAETLFTRFQFKTMVIKAYSVDFPVMIPFTTMKANRHSTFKKVCVHTHTHVCEYKCDNDAVYSQDVCMSVCVCV